MKLLSLLFFISISFNSIAQYLLGNTTLDTTEIYSTLNEPWEILYGNDSSLWITEKRGVVSRINTRTANQELILDISTKVWQVSESGLLGMAFSPNFSTDSLLFLSYTYTDGSNNYLKVVHYEYHSTQDSLLNEVTIIDSIPANTFHDGCRLLFLNDGSLLISTGDAGDINLPQNQSSLAGKFLRLMPDGSIPNDNPTPGSPIFSLGHRNAQGLFYYDNKIYSSEHGTGNDDEMNIIQTGMNYGWPDVQGYCDQPNEMQFCNTNNIEEPIYAWTPTVATSDIVVYDHAAIPEWSKTILLTTLKDQSIIALQLNSSGDSVLSVQTHFKNEWGRLRDLCIGPNGELYVITNGFSRNGNQGAHKIIKIENPNFTSLKENKANQGISLYPNPAYDSISLEASDLNGTLSIFSSSGSLLNESTITKRKTTIELIDFTPGVYFVSYRVRGKLKAKGKFIKL